MKCSFILLTVGILWICSSSLVLGSYDQEYGVSHSSYPAPPVTHGHGQGWGNSGGQHNAGSYYHYHVPLVGQNSHYHPQPHQSNDHHLYYLIPLLLLALLPLLLLPLLPLLLIPLGLSLLALLLPLLMMGGMMMMMMMDGGMMMMMMRNAGVPTRHGFNNNNGDSRAFGFGHLVLDDLSNLVSKYARSLDLDSCPEKFLCETGSFIFPENGTEHLTARTLMNYLVEQATPKGQARRLMRNYKEAFWTGSKTGNCSVYKCQPAFKIYTDTPQQYQQYQQYQRHSHHHNGTNSSSPWNYADYYKNLYGDQIFQSQNTSPVNSNANYNSNSNYNNYYYSNNNNNSTSKPSGYKGKYKKHHFTKTHSQVDSSQFQPITSLPSPNVQVSYSDNENELRSAKV